MNFCVFLAMSPPKKSIESNEINFNALIDAVKRCLSDEQSINSAAKSFRLPRSSLQRYGQENGRQHHQPSHRPNAPSRRSLRHHKMTKISTFVWFVWRSCQKNWPLQIPSIAMFAIVPCIWSALAWQPAISHANIAFPIRKNNFFSFCHWRPSFFDFSATEGHNFCSFCHWRLLN